MAEFRKLILNQYQKDIIAALQHKLNKIAEDATIAEKFEYEIKKTLDELNVPKNVHNICSLACMHWLHVVFENAYTGGISKETLIEITEQSYDNFMEYRKKEIQ